MSPRPVLRRATRVRMVAKSYLWREALREHGVRSGLRHTDMAVLLVLETYSRDDGSNAHPGKERLAANLGVSEATVQRALDNGRRAGWIFCTRRGNYRLGQANVWRMTIPATLDPSQGEAAAGVGQVLPVSAGQQARRHVRTQMPHTAATSSSTGDTPTTQQPSAGSPSDGLTEAQRRAMHEQMLREEGYEEP